MAEAEVCWVEPVPVSEDAVRRLQEELGIRSELAELLVRRGRTDPAAARRFLRPDFSGLHAPTGLPGMREASRRVLSAVEQQEAILVHGDYDADGLCATALLVRALRHLGGRVHAFIPHRARDGYDLGEAGLRRAREVGASLILTADCGTTACRAVGRATTEGMDVVVTDHHQPGPELPPAVAVVNPAREESAYAFDGLSGAGVAFKLAVELHRGRGRPLEEANQHLDLVALGTIADRVPLVDENRVLVRAGLAAMARSRKPGVRALLDSSGRTAGELPDAELVAYRLAPRLNSAGRMGSAESGLQLLLTDDSREAVRLARRLERTNRRRRSQDRRVAREAEALLVTDFDPEQHRAAVLWADDWPEGVLGIAASRLVDRIHRPAVLMTFRGDVGRGSARSPGDFHLYRALAECEDLLERFGGHRSAAGFEVKRERVEEFTRRFHRLAREELDAGPRRGRLPIDLEVPLVAADAELHRALRHLAPFGEANPRPVLRTRGVEIRDLRTVGSGDRHLNLRLVSGGEALQAVGFGMGSRADPLSRPGPWDVAYELTVDRWRGRDRLQARLRDVRPVPGSSAPGDPA